MFYSVELFIWLCNNWVFSLPSIYFTKNRLHSGIFALFLLFCVFQCTTPFLLKRVKRICSYMWIIFILYLQSSSTNSIANNDIIARSRYFLLIFFLTFCNYNTQLNDKIFDNFNCGKLISARDECNILIVWWWGRKCLVDEKHCIDWRKICEMYKKKTIIRILSPIFLIDLSIFIENFNMLLVLSIDNNEYWVIKW